MQRNLLIDIAKCLLIFLVVLGHMPEGSSELHRYIFWFHMPAFFIISGLFLRKEFSLKEEVKKKALRLLVPYAAFSIVFGTVARHGNLPKQIIGTLISAGGIITDFTFPYYFITVLFLAYVFIYVLRKYSNHELLWVIAAYVVTHFLALFAHDKLNWVPWNVDMALCASLYLYVGSKYRNIVTENQGGVICVLILSTLLILDCFGIFHYAYDFHKHDWVMLADILIPVVSLQAVICLSRLLCHIPLLRSVLAYTGRASLVVLLLHAFFIQVNSMIIGDFLSNEWLLALINVAECLVVFRIMTSFRYTRILIGA